MDTVITIVMYLSVVVAAASVLAKGIAPLTDTKWDDRVAGWLTKIKKVLDKVALNKTDTPPT